MGNAAPRGGTDIECREVMRCKSMQKQSKAVGVLGTQRPKAAKALQIGDTVLGPSVGPSLAEP